MKEQMSTSDMISIIMDAVYHISNCPNCDDADLWFCSDKKEVVISIRKPTAEDRRLLRCELEGIDAH